MLGSFKADPQFLAALRQAGEQEEQAARVQSQNQPQMPVPPAPIGMPYRPVQTAGCDDLQQQRICSINDGHLVTSGGCLKCISP